MRASSAAFERTSCAIGAAHQALDAGVQFGDGNRFAHEIIGADHATLPLILMSASRLRLDSSASTGFAAAVRKPARSSRMRAVLVQVIGAQAPAATAVAAPAADPHFSAHILLVDDNEVNVQVGKRWLEKLGCRVDCVTDGAAAVQIRETAYDLVFMDCEMPEMDGYAATRAIRKEDTRHVPAMAMTAPIAAGAREKCIEAGMDSYLAKPLRKAELAEALSGFLASK